MSELMERVSARIRRSQTLRLLTVGVLVVLLQIPIAMIGGQISERELRGGEAAEDVSSKWGRAQTLVGPVLVVPYTHRWSAINREGQSVTTAEVRYAYFLPELLNIRGTAATEIRKRGIFAVPVYRLELQLSGHFARPDFSSLGIEPAAVAWDRAQLVVGVSDTRAIQKGTDVDWDGRRVAFTPGRGGFAETDSAIHAIVEVTDGAPDIEFAVPLSLNGSRSLYFTPFGRETQVELHSNFPHPSFQGTWLPNERSVTGSGFEARWSIPYLGRSFPQAWTGEDGMKDPIEGSRFGVEFLNPVDHYRMAERSVKYASLFILLTFAALWLFEVRADVRVHPIQFLMLGGALCLFYLLLLALSEHLAFALAYSLASLAVVGMVAAYGVVVLRGPGKALALGAGVAGLYGYLYALLVNEDYAFLIGSIGLFVILALIMFATRNVDWYQTASGGRDAGK